MLNRIDVQNDPVNWIDPWGLEGWFYGYDSWGMPLPPSSSVVWNIISDEEKCKELIKWMKEPPSDKYIENLIAGMAGGRAPKLKPFKNAKGPHSVFNKNHYRTYKQTKKGNSWEQTKGFDNKGPSHYNDATDTHVPTPHVHDPLTPGGVRPPNPHEIPMR